MGVKNSTALNVHINYMISIPEVFKWNGEQEKKKGVGGERHIDST